jgi:hypothetical protein
MPRAEIPESVELLTPVMDKLASGEMIVRMQSSATFGRYIDADELPALQAHWLEQLKEELLSKEAVEVAFNGIEERFADDPRSHYEIGLASALASIPIEEGGEG